MPNRFRSKYPNRHFIETADVIGWLIPASSVWTRQEITFGRELTDLAIVFAK